VFVINRILFQKLKQASVEQTLGIFKISKKACTSVCNQQNLVSKTQTSFCWTNTRRL